MMDLRVSQKGCVSVYGLRRFPISLYVEEWNYILGHASEIEKFIADNLAKLSVQDHPAAGEGSVGPPAKSFSEMMGWKR